MSKSAFALPSELDDFDALRSRFVPWFIVSASFIFTALIIVHSLHQGKLAVPATYDDVGYFSDAVERLQILYDHGIGSCLANLFQAPPHAPIATLLAFVGFALFGITDWAPAVMNGIWVALILIFVRALVWDVPRWAYAAIAVSVLSWPLTGSIVVESRPDLFASLLTVMGSTLIFRSRPLQASTRHVTIVAALFGAALVAKPSISPVTLAICCASLFIAIAVEASETHHLNRNLRGEAAWLCAKFFAIVALITLPYYVFAWRHVYSYIYMTVVTQKDIWGARLDALDTVGYYLWGAGGRPMMGPWLSITIFVVIADFALYLLTKRSINRRRIGLYTVFTLAYILVTLPQVKSPYLGVIVPTFLLSFYAMACGSIIGSILHLGRYGRAGAISFAAILLIISAAAFNWPWWWGTASSHFEATQRFEIIRKIGDYLEFHVHGDPRRMVIFSHKTTFLNEPILGFELQKRRLQEVRIVGPNVNNLGELHSSIATADYAVLFDEHDPEILQWTPGSALGSQIRAFVIDDPAFQKDLTVPAADGHHVISVYARKNSASSVSQ
jgi:uncharacterized membrane protein SirB2